MKKSKIYERIDNKKAFSISSSILRANTMLLPIYIFTVFQARIQGRWNGWIFTPPFSEPPSFFFFLSLKHLNQALVLLHYYKNSAPISKSWIRACIQDLGYSFSQYGPPSRWITFYFLPTEILKFQEKFTSASNLCVLKKGAFVLMFYSKRAIDCNPKQNITTWFLTCHLYYQTTKLSLE